MLKRKKWIPKLVRDGIEAKIRRNGEIPITRKLTEYQHMLALADKIVEEAQEVRKAVRARKKNRQAVISETGDLFEATHEFLRSYKISLIEVAQVQNRKFDQLGGFKNRKLLVKVLKQKRQ